MTDDLKARLRSFDPHLHELEVVDEAADRIESLELALTQSRAETAAAYERAALMVQSTAYTSNGDGRSLEPVSAGLVGMDMHHATIAAAIRAIATPDQTAALDKLIAEAVEPYAEALRVLISHTHECERELTEALYHADFCGESRPLTDARAILAASKKGGV